MKHVILLLIITIGARAQNTITFEKYEYQNTEENGCGGWRCGKFGAIKLEPKVVEVPNLSANELYKSTKKWINETYKGGDDIILGDNKDEYIRFEAYSDQLVYQFMLGTVDAVPVYFQVEIRFRDGRYRWEYISWRLYDPSNLMVRPTFFSSFKLLNNRGNPVNSQHLVALEKTQGALASPINSLTKYLLTSDIPDDDW